MSAAVSVVAVLGAGASLAATPALAVQTSPWWHLTSGSRPSHLKAGVGKNEVQEVRTKATEGQFALVEEAKFEIAFLPWNATHTEVQEGLEAIYGVGNVAVSGGEEEPGHARTYLIEFSGALADQPVAPMLAFNFSLEVEGSPGEASLTEKAKGHADGEIILTAANLGTATIDGETTPVQIADTLPPGLEAVSISAVAGEAGDVSHGKPGVVNCVKSSLSCSFEGPLPPYEQIEVRISVVVKEGAHSGEANEVSVSGGETSAAQLSRPIAVSGEPTPFGVEGYELANEEAGGAPATRAGSHPFQQTTTIVLNQAAAVSKEGGYLGHPAVLAKDIHFRWPAGLLGNPSPFPRCTLGQFLTNIGGDANACPAQTAIGVNVVTINETTTLGGVVTFAVPIFNLEPAFGEPARFGFYVGQTGTPVLISPSVRDGASGDYGLTVSVENVTQTVSFLSSEATVWGVPGDPRHDSSRGWGCLQQARETPFALPCENPSNPHPPAFLTLPTSCSGAPPQSSVQGDSWLEPSVLTEPFSSDPALPALDSCNQLPFSPQIKAEPTSDAATSPTGLNFDINVEDEGETNAEGIAQSQIKKAVVTLPEGFTTNPSVAEGLHSCSQGRYESETVNSDPGTGCPENSKVGDVEIESPLVTQKVLGSLFVAKQGENPNANNLLTIYLVAKNPEIGVLIKQALKVTPNPVTGQLTTEVDNIPQLPFSHFHLSFRQGQRSPLITPPTCGTYAVKAALYPYSNPGIPLEEESSFQITQGPEGQGCPSGTPPFHPNLLAGSQNPTAGAYSPFNTRITRRDSEQEITHFSIKLPPGVIGKLAGVSSCSDTAIAAAKAREKEGGGQEEFSSPSCPANSEIGHSNVGSGVGNVLAYAPGKLYLAGPYHGSNLSIVSITAAKVGPFDLGTVVVRFALRINPETAEVFVDSQGSDPIPHIVDGIPVHLRDIQAFVDRKDFTLNPTSCAKTSTASTVLGSGLNFASEADDQPVTVTSPFQVGNCANLGFKPKLTLSLKGGTKRGATPKFKAVLTAKPGEANIAESQVTLPHTEFLEQGHIGTVCTRAQFKEGNVPGEKCPAASIYGKAEAITPLLSEPLKGPVYLRSSSHNLPDLVAALHNNQVDFALDGRIDSVNGGIRNTFEAVPDAPVSKFVLEMQGGKKGLLVNSTNICTAKRRAVSNFAGQNGKVYDTKPVLKAQCGGKPKKKGKRVARAGR